MARYRLCYVNKPADEGMPYYSFADAEDGDSLDDIWNRVHNWFDLGSVVNILDTQKWVDKTFCK